jgi:PiT family inorganic phosphate transporter
MSDVTTNPGVVSSGSPLPQLHAKSHPAGAYVFFLLVVVGLGYAAFSIAGDMSDAGVHGLATGALVLLGLALLIALGFEFVNGFHDTANAVATVIYTHSLPPMVAVIWSGTFNFLGVLGVGAWIPNVLI